MVTKCSVKDCKSKAGQGIKFHRLPKGEIREAWITFLKKYNPLSMPTSSTSVCGLHFVTELDYEITPNSVYQTKRLKKNAIPSIMHQSILRSLLNKSNQELNCVPDHDSEEEIVTSSFSDLNERPVPPAIPIVSCTKKIVLQKPTVQNASTVSSSTAVQYRNEIDSVPVQSKVGDKLLRPNNKRKFFMGDFKHLSDIDSPDNRFKYWNASQSTVTKQKKRIKCLYNQNVDLKIKIKHLYNLVDKLKNEKKGIEQLNYSS